MAEDSAPTPRRQHGHSRAYILERLRRENRTDLADAVERDEVSAFSVAVSLGWTKRPPTLAAVTHQARKRRHRFQALDGSLSAGQLMELQYGPGSAGSNFSSKEELADAWQRARERLLEQSRPGHRPMGWWAFETELEHPGYYLERSTLWRATGVLSESERAALEADWKAAFAEAAQDDFTLNDGSGELLMGDCARAAHYAHHDIPTTLIKRWEKAERRRRARQLAAPSVELEAAVIKYRRTARTSQPRLPDTSYEP